MIPSTMTTAIHGCPRNSGASSSASTKPTPCRKPWTTIIRKSGSMFGGPPFRRLDPSDPQIRGVQASGCFFVADDLGHRPVVGERPPLAYGHVASSDCLLDDAPAAMRREADDGLSAFGTGPARIAGRPGVGRRAYRDPSPCRRVGRQESDAVAVLADRLRPFPLAAPERSMPARIDMGKDCDDRRQPE